jgi:hypothetical protein
MRLVALWFAIVAPVAAAQPVVLLDQIGETGQHLVSGGFVSGYFHHFSTPPVSWGNRATIDDIILTERTRITSIEVALAALPGTSINWNAVPQWRVEIYSNPQIALNNNLTGDSLHLVVPAPTSLTVPFTSVTFGGNPMALVRMDVDVTLDPGMYWPTIIPFNSTTNGYGTAIGSSVGNSFAVWQVLPGNTAVPINQPGMGLRVHGEVAAECYPDCTADETLTIADFGCFQTKFVAADPYADCNTDGAHTIADFGCFQTEFVTGCP